MGYYVRIAETASNFKINPLKWEDVNFFDNDFTDDLGMLTLGQKSSGNPNLMSPNSTLGGDLNKKWKIVNGKRILVKGGTGSTQQEVLNEVVATALYNRLLSRSELTLPVVETRGFTTVLIRFCRYRG